MFSILLVFSSTLPMAEPEMPLWEKDVPATVGAPEKNQPTLTPYLPEKGRATGAAIIVCPGGGYGGLAMDHEGKQVAEWLVQRGISAFVLKYRLANPGRPAPAHPAPMLDVQRAIRLVRSHASKYQLNPAKIGVWGFSAGGHLASTAATHFDAGKKDSNDPVEQQSCRPDLAILAYPVITMGKETHSGSRNNLLGKMPDEELVKFYSNHLQVSKDTPPIFLFHTAEDKAVPIANAELFFEACKAKGVAVEYVRYDAGAHGIGLALKSNLPAKEWTIKLHAWLAEKQWTKTEKPK